MREQRVGKINLAIGGDPSNPTLVMFHGLGGTWRVWQPLIAPLMEKYHVVSVDLPGFGRSKKVGHRNFNLDDVCTAVHEALSDLGITNITLMGYSMGGAVSFNYARRYPDDVAGLILVAPAGLLLWGGEPNLNWKYSSLHWLSRRFQQFIGIPLVTVSRRVLENGFGQYLHDPAKLSKKDARMLLRGSARGRNSGPAGLQIITSDLHRFADEIHAPILLFWGTEDKVVTHKQRVEKLEPLFDDIKVVLMPDTGHLPMFERTELMLEEISSFVSADTSLETFSHV